MKKKITFTTKRELYEEEVRPVPKFRKERDQRNFWNTHDTTEYFDFSKSNRVEIEFDSGIEAPVKSISLRLPREMLNQLKVLANKKDIPYQSLIKVYLAQKMPKSEKPASGIPSTIPHWDGEFPKMSQKTKEKIAYHNGKEYLQPDRSIWAPAERKRTAITKIVES